MTSYDSHGSDSDVVGGGPSRGSEAAEVDDRTIATVANFMGHGQTTAAQDANRAHLREALQHMKPARDNDGLEAPSSDAGLEPAAQQR